MAQPDAAGNAERRTPEEWEQDPQVTRYVVNPDGWTTTPPDGYEAKSWKEPITLEEYKRRALVSTTGPRLH